MHLPVFPQIRPIRVQHRASVVINARRPPLEYGHHQRHLLFLRHRRQSLRSRPRHRLRQIKQFRIFRPAKIFPANSSCRQITCAPRAAASRIFSAARARFSSLFAVQRICTSPTANLSLMLSILSRTFFSSSSRIFQNCHPDRRASAVCWLGAERPWQRCCAEEITGSSNLSRLLLSDRCYPLSSSPCIFPLHF